jgi:hypothetical protein
MAPDADSLNAGLVCHDTDGGLFVSIAKRGHVSPAVAAPCLLVLDRLLAGYLDRITGAGKPKIGSRAPAACGVHRLEYP